jgi:hypothetical protein
VARVAQQQQTRLAPLLELIGDDVEQEGMGEIVTVPRDVLREIG